MKRIFSVFLIVFLFFASKKVLALNYIDVNVESSNAILYDVTDDIVMYEKQSDERIKIASLTKIMTAIVAIEKINNLDELITIAEKDYKNVYSENLAIVGFQVGEQVTYRDLLYGLLLKSGADAGYALADHIAGSEENFVLLMNQKAADIGLKNTKFTNVVGYDQDNYSTVRDVALFFKYALENKTFKEMISTNTYTTTNKKFTLVNVIDDLIKNTGINSQYSDYIIGGKTGYTLEAKLCLASAAEYNGTTYISVTAKGDKNKHISDTIKLYEQAFTNYSRKKIVNVDDYLVSVSTPKLNEVKIYADKDVDVLLPNEATKNDVKLQYKGITNINNNIQKNELLGKVNVEYNGEILKSIDVFYNKKIQNSMNYYHKSKPVIQRNHKSMGLIIFCTLVGLIFLFIASFFISMYIDVKKHKRRWKF